MKEEVNPKQRSGVTLAVKLTGSPIPGPGPVPEWCPHKEQQDHQKPVMEQVTLLML